MQAYLIDSTAREIREVDYAQSRSDGPTLQDHLGGYIEGCYYWDTGEVCYVDEEFLFKPQTGGFWIAGRTDQPMMGNGIVVGAENLTEDGDYLGTLPPSFTIEQLRRDVRFVTRAEVDAWSRGNTSPGVAFTSLDDGTTEVIATMGSLFGDMPQPRDEEDKP